MTFPRVTTILQPFADFSMVPPDVLQAAADRGVAVHSACEAHALGLFSTVPEDLQGYFASFKMWFDSYVVEVLGVEVELTHPQWRYVGHADLIARVRGLIPTLVIAIIDFKTPLALTPAARCQAAAYVEAARKDYGAEVGGLLQLRKDGSLPKMTWVQDQNQAFNAFTGILSGWNYIKANGGGK